MGSAINSLAGHPVGKELRKGGEEFKKKSSCGSYPLNSRCATFDNLPPELLQTILSYLPTVSGENPLASPFGLKGEIDYFNSLGRINRKFYHLVEATRGLFVKTLLDRWGSLGHVMDHKDRFLHGSNLDLESLKTGFKLYLEDPKSKFSKLKALDRQIQELTFTLFEEATLQFPGLARMKVDSKYKNFFQSGPGKFEIGISLQSLSISTPLHLIQIREHSQGVVVEPEESEKLIVLPISKALISYFGATFKGLNSLSTRYYELPEFKSPNQGVRKVKFWELIELEEEEIGHIKIGQRIVVPRVGYSSYKIGNIGEWQSSVLATADFICKNNGLLPDCERLKLPSPKMVKLPQSEMLNRTRYIADCFWGSHTHDNVIISLFERGELKTLSEVHTFMEERVVIEMYMEEGLSKSEIVDKINLPFVKQKHPFKDCTGIEELIAKYESGASNKEIYLSEGKSIIKYFWGAKGEIVVWAILNNLLSLERQEVLFAKIYSLFLGGKSREEILEGFGLPSASYIYYLIESFVYREGLRYPAHGDSSSYVWIYFENTCNRFFESRECKALSLMIKKALSTLIWDD